MAHSGRIADNTGAIHGNTANNTDPDKNTHGNQNTTDVTSDNTTTANNSAEDILDGIYNDPRHPAGFSNPNLLYKHVKGYGISQKQVEEYLRAKDSYTLHKQTRRGKRNRIVVNDIDEQWEMDLADLPAISDANDGYRYILCCIDVLSKYAWTLSLKRKTGPVLLEAVKKIIETSGRKPTCIRVDKGGEFVNRHMKEYCKKEGIKLYMAQNEVKAAIVERFQKTLKGYMWRYFTRKNTRRYVDKLQDFVYAYNHRVHRSIKRRPVDVTKSNAHEVREVLYKNKRVTSNKSGTTKNGSAKNKRIPKKIYRFAVGDNVRISRLKGLFEKGYEANWSEEIFTVMKRATWDVPMYRIKDSNNEPLTGHFYEFELQKVTPPEYYIVEEIINERGKGDKKEYYVKWRGYPTSANSWIKASDVVAQ